jgi:Holliday junction resolvase RusA-like endonuclease
MAINVTFEVDGLPPRKDGGHSMWNKDNEVKKLLELRSQFHNTILKQQISTPITNYLRLNIEIYLSEKDLVRSDIDNLVGGVFDGLQSASNATKLNNVYNQYKGTPIHPSNSFILDDSRILELNVKKIISERRTFYRVSTESINLNDIKV